MSAASKRRSGKKSEGKGHKEIRDFEATSGNLHPVQLHPYANQGAP